MTKKPEQPYTKAQEEAHRDIDMIWREMVAQLQETSEKLAGLTSSMQGALLDTNEQCSDGDETDPEYPIRDERMDDMFDRLTESDVAERMNELHPAILGDLFRDYFNESVHNNWDGHLQEEREAYYVMFRDMLRFNHNLGKKI
jgi:hypothetical protein